MHFNLTWATLCGPVAHREADLTHPIGNFRTLTHTEPDSKHSVLPGLACEVNASKAYHNVDTFMFFVGVGLVSHNDLTDVDPIPQG